MIILSNQKTCIILIGSQGSGKGTQCTKLVEKYNLPYFEMGDILRKQKVSNPKIAQIMSQGQLLPDDIVQEFVNSFIQSVTTNNFLMDGFPRNIDQASWLSSFLELLGFRVVIINLVVSDRQVLIDRMLARSRSDDTIDVIHRRLDTYDQLTLPLIAYFHDLGSSVHTIDASKSSETVFQEIDDALLQI